jgi:hypothetical protein
MILSFEHQMIFHSLPSYQNSVFYFTPASAGIACCQVYGEVNFFLNAYELLWFFFLQMQRSSSLVVRHVVFADMHVTRHDMTDHGGFLLAVNAMKICFDHQNFKRKMFG